MVEILQQYKSLNVNGSKFFYYSYGKLDMKIQAILKENDKTYEEVQDMDCLDLSINISYDEIKSLTKRNRIERRDIDNIIKDIKNNSMITLEDEDKIKLVSIYDCITIDKKSKRVIVEFNKNAVLLFQGIRQYAYSNIDFNDIVNLKNVYEVNLYLYAITILRGSKGVVNIKIDTLREILASDSKIDDYHFVSRFVNKPARSITNNEDIKLTIVPIRKNDIIHFNVYK